MDYAFGAIQRHSPTKRNTFFTYHVEQIWNLCWDLIDEPNILDKGPIFTIDSGGTSNDHNNKKPDTHINRLLQEQFRIWRCV